MVSNIGMYRQWAVCVGMCVFAAAVLASTETPKSETLTIEQRLEQLQNEINQLKEMQARQKAQQQQYQHTLDSYRNELDTKADVSFFRGLEKLRFGGYGEMHANFEQGSDSDLLDFHRLVVYLGYDFSDWIQWNSEWELEHAYVTDTADGSNGGDFLVEQAYFDFRLTDLFNVRAGRVLTPLGITNKKHEPPLFNGVERPSFDKYIIPTTWSSDGAGIFGNLRSNLSYEAYVVGGLDGSKFDAIDGIRPGRIKEQPSLNDPAVTGRLDYYPELTAGHTLRLGTSAYFGGLNNGNKGKNPDIDGDIQIVSADFEYSVAKWDFRGAIAQTHVDGARQIGNGTASEMFGWYLEGGYHIWPDEFKVGKLANSDAVAFIRYDKFDTQYKMPSGVSADPAGDRDEWTFGINFYFTPNVVFKTDYQMQQDSADNKTNKLNFGLGFSF